MNKNGYCTRDEIHKIIVRELGHDVPDKEINEILKGTTVIDDKHGNELQPYEDVLGLIITLKGGYYQFD